MISLIQLIFDDYPFHKGTTGLKIYGSKDKRVICVLTLILRVFSTCDSEYGKRALDVSIPSSTLKYSNSKIYSTKTAVQLLCRCDKTVVITLFHNQKRPIFIEKNVFKFYNSIYNHFAALIPEKRSICCIIEVVRKRIRHFFRTNNSPSEFLSFGCTIKQCCL